MEYFAALTLPEFGSFVAVLAGMLVGFYGITKFILSQSSKDRESDREERKELSMAIERMAKATEQSAREAKERNGHLGEQNVQITELIAKHAEVMSRELDNINKKIAVQNVSEQVVEHQHINSKE